MTANEPLWANLSGEYIQFYFSVTESQSRMYGRWEGGHMSPEAHKHLAFRNLWRNFDSIASFWVLKFNTPSPPSFFGFLTMFQSALDGFLDSMSTPLQIQCVLYLSICSKTVICIWKVLIANVRRAVVTEFAISSLPAWLRKQDVAISLLSHLVTSGEKSMTLHWVLWGSEGGLGK